MNNKYLGLHNLRITTDYKKKFKRVGRGESSGFGKTSGRGHKGQKSRKSGSVRFGFEGGQTSIIRRLPKRGFKSYKQDNLIIATINIDRVMEKFPVNSIITINKLREYKVIKGKNFIKIKFISGNKKMHPLSLDTNYISKSLKVHLEKIGGRVTFVK